MLLGLTGKEMGNEKQIMPISDLSEVLHIQFGFVAAVQAF